MSKRGAASELNDRNWDVEEEPEEAGQFIKASTEVLQKRQIVKARRKNEDKPSGGNTFSGFSGFALKPSTGSIGGNSLFSNCLENKNSTNNSANTDSQSETGQSETDKTLVNGGAKNTSKKSAYYQSLKGLNASVVTWITNHVEKNPYCILTPIFKDYEKHMDRLEKEKQESEQKAEKKESSDSKPLPETKEKSSTDTSGFSFGSFSSNTASKPAFSGFNFGSSTATEDKKPAFSFTTNQSNISQETGEDKKPAFSFSASKPLSLSQETSDDKKPAFSFAVSKPTLSQETTDSQGEEEYVPPKPEVIEVQEEGSFYTKRCKLFYQKDGEWKERGVGNIHLKSCDGDKTQLLVRADTSLGNILLNIMLSSSIPTKRQGKNNVSLFCIPNPPVDPKGDPEKPVSMLIRVKTAEDADELLQKLEEKKA